MDNLAYYERYEGKILDGRYKIEKVVGIGGMAVVFRATDTENGGTVAVKMLKDDLAEDAEAIRRFENEANVISALSHPNIVGIYKAYLNRKRRFLVMEYIEGISLRTYMDKRGKALDFEEVRSYSEQILAALNHAHEHGIVHRDIKPQNILLLKDGIVKVTDFGIAGVAGTDESQMENNKAIGTVYYISPEQADAGYADERSDLYSLGIVMYEMATGKLPFDGDSAISVVMKQINEKPVSPRKINRRVPRGLRNIILHALDKNPEKRYQSALDMFRELRKLRYNRFAHVLSPSEVKKAKRSKKNHEENQASRTFTPVVLGIALSLFLVAVVSLFICLDRIEIGGLNRESISVPEVEGMYYRSLEDCGGDKSAYAEALAEIGLDKNYTVEVEYEYSDYADSGVIIRQSPAAGASRKSPAKVTLTVSLGTETVTVEDFTIIDWRLARAKLMEKGFSVKIVKEENISIKAGAVIGTVPEPGTTVKKGSEITLRVSLGVEAQLVSLPDFFGKKEPAVLTQLKALGLEVGNVIYTRSSLDAGCIISQTPEAKTNVYFGADEVDFIVSGGPDFNTNVYPDVMGLTKDEAVSLLTIYGISDLAVIKVKSEADENTVVYQYPSASDYSKSTASATIQISGGPEYSHIVNVFNVTGEKTEDAKLLLDYCFGDDASVIYRVTTVRDDAKAGTVIAQQPAAGVSVDVSGGRIYVYLTESGGPDYTETLSVPDVTGYELSEVCATLEEIGITPILIYKASSEDENIVIGQQYEPDSEITGLQGLITMEIYVSGGPNYVETAKDDETSAPQEETESPTADTSGGPAETSVPAESTGKPE